MSVGFCRRRISHVKQKQGDQICWKYFIYIIIASLCFLAVQSDSVVFTNFFQFHVYLLWFSWILFIAFVALLKCSFLLQPLSTITWTSNSKIKIFVYAEFPVNFMRHFGLNFQVMRRIIYSPNISTLFWKMSVNTQLNLIKIPKQNITLAGRRCYQDSSVIQS